MIRVSCGDTVEVVVAAVTGSLSAPERLILALVDQEQLTFAGTTSDLNARQRAEVAALLEPVPVDEPHPWPPEMADRGIGRWGGNERTSFTLVRPQLVVEISADTAIDGGRWRHTTRFVRTRPDLTPAEVGALG